MVPGIFLLSGALGVLRLCIVLPLGFLLGPLSGIFASTPVAALQQLWRSQIIPEY